LAGYLTSPHHLSMRRRTGDCRGKFCHANSSNLFHPVFHLPRLGGRFTLASITNASRPVVEMASAVLKIFGRPIHPAFWFYLAGTLLGERGMAADQPKVDFSRDIQPIFIKRCYECHGPDKQKNDLRLDHKEDAFRGGKSRKPIFAPGKSAESHLIERVTAKDPDEIMPNKGEPLTAEQIALLRAWID